MKSITWLLHDEKRKRVGKLKDIDGDDDILKECYELLHSSRKRYKRLKVQAVAVNNQWQMALAYLERYKMD